MPALLSALVYPGAGQFMQKRVVWGLLYAIIFTVFLILSFVMFIRGIYDAFMNGTGVAEVLHLVAKPVAACAAIWLVNVLDAWWVSSQRAKNTDSSAPALH